jgi:hypothetical protein
VLFATRKGWRGVVCSKKVANRLEKRKVNVFQLEMALPAGKRAMRTVDQAGMCMCQKVSPGNRAGAVPGNGSGFSSWKMQTSFAVFALIS